LENTVKKSKVTKEEVISAMKKCAQEVGHAPSFVELHKREGVTSNAIRRFFCTYKQALRACGMERQGGGHALSMKALFADFAAVVRKLGRTPRVSEYELYGRHSQQPMLRAFGKWKHVAAALLEFGRKEGLQGEWGDAMEMIEADLVDPEGVKKASTALMIASPTKPRMLMNEPIYGPPIMLGALTYCPTNEAGVAVLFGAMARDLGFAVTRVQSAFPDCEAMREVAPDKWQRIRIEFEYESRNFLAHLHPVEGCDLIICWRHNWPECPLEVVELKSAVRQGLLPQICADDRR
jgi:hypothetical protein